MACPECCYFKPSVHSYYGTIKNFTEGRKGHEGKNPPSRSALRRASRRSPACHGVVAKREDGPGSNVGALNPVPAIPLGARWAPPAAVLESLRPSVNGFRF
jgi:hypothetical protein